MPSSDASKLRQVVALVQAAAEVVTDEWSKTTTTHQAEATFSLPSQKLYQAQRTLAAAAGSIEELVCDPSLRILGFSTQYWEARALHIAVEHRIPDLLDNLGGAETGHGDGVRVSELAGIVGIEERKLSRVLRCLTSQHIFRETGPDTFANNRVSQALVGNEPLRAYVMLFALDPFSTADYLPVSLKDPVAGPSYKVDETAFNMAVGTNKPRWEWLEEKIHGSAAAYAMNSRGYPHDVVGGITTTTSSSSSSSSGAQDKPTTTTTTTTNGGGDSGDGALVARPELPIFAQAMVGGGRITSTPHLFDYPWQELGRATFVDVGGGQGGFPLQLSRLYPDLSFVVEDRRSMTDQGEAFWAKENPEALASGRVRFVPHDFFTENPVKGAEVYWLRYIMHDWSDDYCVTILSAIRAAMGPNSRILISDQVMHTTTTSPDLAAPAPEPLLANYGNYVRYSHQRDLAMMAMINGIERTPAQFRGIVEKAGLRLVKIWDCRTQVSLVECRLA